MATTQQRNGAAPIESAFEHVKDFNERVVAAARKTANVYVDSYEKTVDRTIELERKFAGLTQQEWLTSLIEAQADFTREMARSYATTARSLLK